MAERISAFRTHLSVVRSSRFQAEAGGLAGRGFDPHPFSSACNRLSFPLIWRTAVRFTKGFLLRSGSAPQNRSHP